MDRRLIAMRLAAPVLVSIAIAIACGFGADPSSDGTGDTGNGTGTGTADSTGADPKACGEAPSSLLGPDGACYCEPGTTWLDPFNPSAFECGALEPRSWGPCPSDGNPCECGADVRVPDYCSATGNTNPTMVDGALGCGFEEIFACTCPPADTDGDSGDMIQCTCPSVYTCTCPEYQRWCAFEPGRNDVECCYDAAQDPDGTHVPSDETTEGTRASSSDDGSTSAASSSTTSSETGASETTG